MVAGGIVELDLQWAGRDRLKPLLARGAGSDGIHAEGASGKFESEVADGRVAVVHELERDGAGVEVGAAGEKNSE